MRIAIISDIHGNLEALKTALDVIDAGNVGEILCLGDTVGYGANPNECLELVRARCSNILLGNHDQAAFDMSAAASFTHTAQLSAHWTFKVLTEDNRSFLRGLDASMRWDGVMLAHASPYDPEDWNYVISEFDAQDAFRSFEENLCFVGHTHMPIIFSEHGRATTIDRRERFLVNVGSIGQPRDRNPKLSFGMFDTDSWTYENMRVKYDIDTAAKKIREAGLPHALADRLYQGM